MNEQLGRAREERAALATRQVDPLLLEKAAAEEAEVQAALTGARAALEQAEQARAAAAITLASAREARSAAEFGSGKARGRGAGAGAEILACEGWRAVAAR